MAHAGAKRLCGVYIHLPFCDVKCAYCDFYSLANRHVDAGFWEKYADKLDDDLSRQYALLREDTPRPVLASIFFGGGTPSKAPVSLIHRVTSAVRARFELRLPNQEITAEANPESLTAELLRDWRAAGINRVSVGLQSLEEKTLKYLGRLYDPKAYREVLAHVRAAGFSNFSCDFITGVPGQSVESTMKDLEFALAEGVTHLSLYQLTLEPGTLLKSRVDAGKRERPRDAAQALQMDTAIAFLGSRGFDRYEISNFARGNHRALHNLVYWSGRPYLGLGVSAHAFTGRRRFFHPRSLEKYMDTGYYLAEDLAVSGRDVLINWLRLRRNIRIDKIAGLFSAGQRAEVDRVISAALSRGWLKRNQKLISLTHEGLKYSDSLLNDFWNLENLR